MCLACEVWMLVLQPWIARDVAAGYSVVKASARRVYSDKWRPYIAANIHLYTTLLACFLKMVSRLNSISGDTTESKRHFHLLTRVLKVFTPELISVVDALINGFRTWYIERFSIGNQQLTSAPYLATPAKSVAGGEVGSGGAGGRGTGGRGGGGGEIGGMTDIDATPAQKSANEPPMVSVATQQELLVMYAHHCCVFPDRTLDQLPGCGVTDFRSSAKDAGVFWCCSVYAL